MTGDLKTMAEQTLSEARRQLEQTGTLEPYFLLRSPAGGRIARVPVPPDAMNNGDMKDRLFALVRAVVERTQTSAVIFVSDGWAGRSTAKAAAIGKDNFLREVGRGRGFEEAIKQGLVERSEAILLSVQTPEEILMVQQLYDRLGERIVFTERIDMATPQCDFTGRMKMYGDLREENLG